MQINIAELKRKPHGPYRVWEMDKKGDARLVASRSTFAEAQSVARELLDPEVYIYIVRWWGTRHSFECGFLDGKVHREDLRTDVRRVLRGGHKYQR